MKAIPKAAVLPESRTGRLARAASKPVLIVLSGLPGSGKSFFAGKLAERLPAVILESDSVRKRLFPAPLYSADENARVFTVMHRLAEELNGAGVSVIIDATNLTERLRRVYYEISRRTGARLIPIQVTAPEAMVKQRLEQRSRGAAGASNSDAGWEVYQKMKPVREKIRRRHFRVDTSRDLAPAVARIMRAVIS